MSEWSITTINRLGGLFDGPHATPTRIDHGPYFLNIASLHAGRLDLTASDHVSEADFERWTRRVAPRRDDLLFSYETRLGEAALMPEGVRACLGRRMALLRPDPNIVDPRFLLYLYLSPNMQKTIELNTIHGATVNRIPLNRMGSWEVSIPDLVEQQSIAEVLGALDDKIAANTTLAATIWELLATEFRSLHAEGELTSKTLRDLTTLEYGKALPAAEREPGPVAVIGSGGVNGSHSVALVQDSGVVVGRKGTAGRVIWVDGPHFPIDTTFYARGTRDVFSQPYLYFLLGSLRLDEMNNDSAVPGLNRSEALALPVRVPPDQSLASFATKAAVLIDATRARARENRTLAATRDALIPQLMSGKLRVRDAEKLASHAGA